MNEEETLQFLVELKRNLKRDLEHKCSSIHNRIQLLSSSKFTFKFNRNESGQKFMTIVNSHQWDSEEREGNLTIPIVYESSKHNIEHLIDIVRSSCFDAHVHEVDHSWGGSAYILNTERYCGKGEISLRIRFLRDDLYELSYHKNMTEVSEHIKESEDADFIIHKNNLLEMLIELKDYLY